MGSWIVEGASIWRAKFIFVLKILKSMKRWGYENLVFNSWYANAGEQLYWETMEDKWLLSLVHPSCLLRFLRSSDIYGRSSKEIIWKAHPVSKSTFGLGFGCYIQDYSRGSLRKCRYAAHVELWVLFGVLWCVVNAIIVKLDPSRILVYILILIIG